MMYNGEPETAFLQYDADQAEAEKRWLRTRPVCVVCNEPIEEDLTMCVTHWKVTEERMLSCVHPMCLKRELNKGNPALSELVWDYLFEDEECYGQTPIMEEENKWDYPY